MIGLHILGNVWAKLTWLWHCGQWLVYTFWAMFGPNLHGCGTVGNDWSTHFGQCLGQTYMAVALWAMIGLHILGNGWAKLTWLWHCGQWLVYTFWAMVGPNLHGCGTVGNGRSTPAGISSSTLLVLTAKLAVGGNSALLLASLVSCLLLAPSPPVMHRLPMALDAGLHSHFCLGPTEFCETTKKKKGISGC